MTPELADRLDRMEPLNEEFERALRTDLGYVLALARQGAIQAERAERRAA